MAIVMSGGSFAEADEAKRQESNKLAEIGEANARTHGLGGLHVRDDGSTCSKRSNKIRSSVIKSMKRRFGRRRNSDLAREDLIEHQRGGTSVKTELEQVRGIIEEQRKEIDELRLELGQQKSMEEFEQSSRTLGATYALGSGADDSERYGSYPPIRDQQLVHEANTKVSADMECFDLSNTAHSSLHPTKRGGSTSVAAQKTNNRSSLVSIGAHDFDRRPPMPPDYIPVGSGGSVAQNATM